MEIQRPYTFTSYYMLYTNIYTVYQPSIISGKEHDGSDRTYLYVLYTVTAFDPVMGIRDIFIAGRPVIAIK
jgi:hypothetical protein